MAEVSHRPGREGLVAVIPARNAAATVGDVVRGALRHCGHVVVGDDASEDGTAEAALRAGARVLTFPRHLGKGAVLRRLFEEALTLGAEAAVALDADAQHDPGDIPRFLDAAAAHPGALVVGDRMAEGGAIPAGRLLALRAAAVFLEHAAGIGLADTQCGFRLVPSGLMRRCATRAPRFAMETEFLIAAVGAGVSVARVPVAARYGDAGHASHFRPTRDFLSIASVVWACLVLRVFLGFCGVRGPASLGAAARWAGALWVRLPLLAMAPALVPTVCMAAWLWPGRAGIFGGTRAGAVRFAADVVRLAAAVGVAPLTPHLAADLLRTDPHPHRTAE